MVIFQKVICLLWRQRKGKVIDVLNDLAYLLYHYKKNGAKIKHYKNIGYAILYLNPNEVFCAFLISEKKTGATLKGMEYLEMLAKQHNKQFLGFQVQRKATLRIAQSQGYVLKNNNIMRKDLSNGR